MTENLFGRVPVGGITPSSFDPDFSDIFTEEQLQLDKDIFERQKFTEDRTLRLAAAEDVAGFDLSKIHNHFAIDFKHQTDAFQKEFNGGEMTPEQITAESLRLSSLYNEYSGFYVAQRDFVKGAVNDPKALEALNKSLPAGSTFYTDKTLAQMDANAGLLWEEGSYDPKTNKAVYRLDDGTMVNMTLEEALRYQSMHGSIGSINNIGPYMFGKTDVDLGNLHDEATNDKADIAVRSNNGEWSEVTAGEVFDSRLTGDKLFRGIIREEIDVLLTDEEKIAFDNQTYMLDPNYTGPSEFDVAKFNAIIDRAREKYIEGSKFTKVEEKADAGDKKERRDSRKLDEDKGRYFQTITAEQQAVTLQGETEETNQTTAINVPVPAGQEVTIPIQGEGEVKVSAIRIEPMSGNVYVTASTDYEAVINKQISNVQITHILNEINEYYQLSGDDAFGNIDDIIERANAGQFGVIDSDGQVTRDSLTIDEIIEGLSDGVSEEGVPEDTSNY